MIEDNDKLNDVLKALGLPELKANKTLPPLPKNEPHPAFVLNHGKLPMSNGRLFQSPIYPSQFNVRFADRDHVVGFWNGHPTTGQHVAIDTKTAFVGRGIRPLALMSACSGVETFIVHPRDVLMFLDVHKDRRLVFHDAGFNFWVLHEHCIQLNRPDLATNLWEKANRNEFGDVMVLDQLIRLATSGESPSPRDLPSIVENCMATKDIDGKDPTRLRYNEIIGKEWHHVDERFFRSVAKDVIGILLAYHALHDQATTLSALIKDEAWHDAVARFGLLTEATQIKAAIALSSATRLGMAYDVTLMARKDEQLKAAMNRILDKLRGMRVTEGLFSYDRFGAIKRTEYGAPKINNKRLQGILQGVIRECAGKGLPAIELTKSELLGVSEDDWKDYRKHSLFVRLWLGLSKLAKMRQFTQFVGGTAHPKYTVMVLTGRTACSDPNLQQTPRQGGFREFFFARPGYYFFIIDYKFIELVSLAAVCEKRYEKSRLAEIIREGIDPHSYTAALMIGMDPKEFQKLKRTEPKRFKDLRQKAKAVNFGIPGGMGGGSLQEYALDNYGVNLSKDEADQWREKMITVIYPELSLYLADTSMGLLAERLECTVDELWNAVQGGRQRPDWLPMVMEKVLAGEGKKDGTPYSLNLCEQIWQGLAKCCRNTQLLPLIQSRRPCPELAALCHEAAITLTGRIRNNTTYTEARNSRFQGLTSDGAKLACFELVRARYRLVGFVHDEFILELPIEADHTAEAANIEKIICGAMSVVINGTVPVQADYALSKIWSKSAEAVFDEKRRLIQWTPKSRK